MYPNAYSDKWIPEWPTQDPGWLQGVDWPLALNPNAPIKTEEVYRLIWQYGVRALWEAASKCPCRARDGDTSPREDCPVCHGSGWYFHHPQIVRAASLGIRRELKPLEIPGDWQNGQVAMTVRPEYCPSQWDRLTLIDARMSLNIMATREAAIGALESLRWPVAKKILDMHDGTQKTLDVVEILPMTADGLPRVDGFGNPYPLVRGVEFDVTYSDLAEEGVAIAASPSVPRGYTKQQTGQITWALGDALATPPLPQGRAFSIVYYTMPVYAVTSFQHSIRDSRTNLGMQSEKNLPLPVQFQAQLEAFRSRDAA